MFIINTTYRFSMKFNYNDFLNSIEIVNKMHKPHNVIDLYDWEFGSPFLNANLAIMLNDNDNCTFGFVQTISEPMYHQELINCDLKNEYSLLRAYKRIKKDLIYTLHDYYMTCRVF